LLLNIREIIKENFVKRHIQPNIKIIIIYNLKNIFIKVGYRKRKKNSTY
jgi:hypothetical protein